LLNYEIVVKKQLGDFSRVALSQRDIRKRIFSSSWEERVLIVKLKKEFQKRANENEHVDDTKRKKKKNLLHFPKPHKKPQLQKSLLFVFNPTIPGYDLRDFLNGVS